MGLLDTFGQPAWRHLVFAFLHTLWQGAVIALLAALAPRSLPARRQAARYLVAPAAQVGASWRDSCSGSRSQARAW